MTAFDDLLDLQALDTTIDQLTHRLAGLPEQAALEVHVASVAAHDGSTAQLQSRRDEMGREQKRIEDEVASVEAKSVEVDHTLYSGSVTSPRELQAFQDDLTALKRRQRHLEDAVIEVMEQVEPLDAELVARRAQRAELETVTAALGEALDLATAGTGTDLASAQGRRVEVRANVSADLLDHYEMLRKQMGGIAVAPLVGTNCGGCHLTLSSVELDRIKHEPVDAWVHCGECDRLLVR